MRALLVTQDAQSAADDAHEAASEALNKAHELKNVAMQDKAKQVVAVDVFVQDTLAIPFLCAADAFCREYVRENVLTGDGVTDLDVDGLSSKLFKILINDGVTAKAPIAPASDNTLGSVSPASSSRAAPSGAAHLQQARMPGMPGSSNKRVRKKTADKPPVDELTLLFVMPTEDYVLQRCAQWPCCVALVVMRKRCCAT